MSGQIILVVARADNGVIGHKNSLPWRVSADLKRFKRLTMGPDDAGLPMIMGRTTFESLPGILPGRRHIVLTRQQGWSAPGAQIAHDVQTALALARKGTPDTDIAIIGGAQIYALFLPFAHRIELTEVHIAPDGDTYMPALAGHWVETQREELVAAGETPSCSFITLERIEP